MTDFFGKNLKYIRINRGLTLSEMSDFIGFSHSQWNNWELSTSFPKFLDLIEISKKLGIPESELIHSDLSKGANKVVLNKYKKGANDGANDGANPLIFTPSDDILQVSDVIDQYGEQITLNVYDFKGSKAAAGNVVHILQNADKQRLKPNLYLPGLGPGIHIRIPIGGDSMHNTIKDGDKPVATLITDIANVRPGHIYLIIDKTDGIQCKRVYFDDSENVELVSDNEVYSPYKRHLNDIVAFFKVREVHTKDLRPYFNDLRKEMREIKQEMASIRRLITK